MRLIFVTGGARSGKSKFACELAEKCDGEIAYIATAEAKDEEMQKRVEEHRRKRPSHWKLIEEPLDMQSALQKATRSECIIVDCLTLLITNWLLAPQPRTLRPLTLSPPGGGDACCNVSHGGTANVDCDISNESTRDVGSGFSNEGGGAAGPEVLKKLAAFIKELKQMPSTSIIVSNEVGMGIVPENKLGRVFRDICGEVNQMIAEEADEVYLLTSGIPQRIKGLSK